MPRPIIFALFLSVFPGLLFLANLVVYKSAALALSGAGIERAGGLGMFLGLMSGGFIAASVVGSRFYNRVTRAAYILFAVWMGLFAYLFIASVAYGALAGAATLMGLAFPLGAIGAAFFLVALAVSSYGLAHARRIKVKEERVVLPGLPPAWEGRRGVLISDLHLGLVYGAAFSRKVASAVNACSPDIVFLAGDLFDGTNVREASALAAPLSAISSPLGTYFVSGNHEEFGDSGGFLAAARATGLRVLAEEKIDIDGVQIVGVSHGTAAEKEEFCRILEGIGIDRARPSVLLKHEPKDLSVAEEAGISLQLSGHTHKGQQWPFSIIASLVYKGFSYGHARFGAMQVFVSSGVGSWGPPLRVGSDAEIVVLSFSTASPVAEADIL